MKGKEKKLRATEVRLHTAVEKKTIFFVVDVEKIGVLIKKAY